MHALVGMILGVLVLLGVLFSIHTHNITTGELCLDKICMERE